MYLRLILLSIFFISCSSKGNFELELEIKGLKKGKIILSKVNDSTSVIIDSVLVKGDNLVKFKKHHSMSYISEPEILYVDLILNDGNSYKTLSFFAEPKKIKVVSSLDKFGYEIKVSGSKNDSLLRDYVAFNRKFNDQKLDLIKSSLELNNQVDKDSLEKIDEMLISLNKRQFLYNANFALRHSDFEVSPYIAITDLKESKKIMDTIYKSLSDDIKKSKYAENLKKLLSN